MENRVPVTAAWLSDEVIGLRAPLIDDAGEAERWYEGPSGSREDVEIELRRQERIPWGRNPTIRLIAVELATGSILAGVVVDRSANRTGRLTVTCLDGEERATVLSRIFSLLLQWLFDEVGLMTAVLRVPADDAAMIRAAEAAGMRVAVRLREHIRRKGCRVDLLELERVNMDWGRYAG
jgi:hypothetical protein